MASSFNYQSVSLQGPGKLSGEFTPPGDKSISHRAIMFGALAAGKSSYTHFLEAEDCLNTAEAFRKMGVSVNVERGTGKLEVIGVGLYGLKAPSTELWMGNSGTTTRLMMGILSGQKFEVVLTGDPSLSSRPMKRVTVPLKTMGAQIKGKDNGNFAPLTIRGGKLKGIEFDNKLASAQVKSALLFAGMYADGITKISEPIQSRDHSERFLRMAGAPLIEENGSLTISKTELLKPIQAAIPGDISSAAFFIAGAAAIPGSEMVIRSVCLNPTRTGILKVLERMGADIRIEPTQEFPEPIGNLFIKGKKLKGTRIVKEEVPSLIDELPILMTIMALSEGESLVTGAEELRVKETDRIQSMCTNLRILGVPIEELPDGCMIKGIEQFHSGQTVQSYADHRTAMSMAIASLAMKGSIEIQDIACIATSFPAFFKTLSSLKP